MNMQLKTVLMVMAVAMLSHSANGAPVIENAQGPMGLRISHAEVVAIERVVIVDARISRSRLTRVLTPMQLQFNLVNADGTVAAEETIVVSAADLVRLNARDRHVKVAFANLPEVENYTVSVQWL
jgi:hypothetical protein